MNDITASIVVTDLAPYGLALSFRENLPGEGWEDVPFIEKLPLRESDILASREDILAAVDACPDWDYAKRGDGRPIWESGRNADRQSLGLIRTQA